jgi:hypothetical protein
VSLDGKELHRDSLKIFINVVPSSAALRGRQIVRTHDLLRPLGAAFCPPALVES